MPAMLEYTRLGRSTPRIAFSKPLFLDRKSTRLNSSHTVIYTLSLHDALPILVLAVRVAHEVDAGDAGIHAVGQVDAAHRLLEAAVFRSEEHTSELQSHRDLHSFPTRRSSDLSTCRPSGARGRCRRCWNTRGWAGRRRASPSRSRCF